MGRRAEHAPASRSLLLATTTSTQDSGLLDEIVPPFEKETGIEVKVIAVGTGAALKMAARGDADAVLVHAPEAERPLVESGELVEGRRVMHNDFLLVGPADDPARAAKAATLVEALAAIAETGTFVSRGDESGTHRMEMSLWKVAGVDPARVTREETGQGMGATLHVADQKGAYTLVDRGTWLALRKRLALQPISEGDSRLRNVYSVHVVSPAKHPAANAAAARRFVEHLVAPETQRAIGAFGAARHGAPLFVPDAVP